MKISVMIAHHKTIIVFHVILYITNSSWTFSVFPGNSPSVSILRTSSILLVNNPIYGGMSPAKSELTQRWCYTFFGVMS